jgi:hypothetical protein
MSNLIYGLRLTNAEHFRWLVSGRLPNPLPEHFAALAIGVRAPNRFPGICSDAKALGIRRESLWRYLSGEWSWPVVTKRRYELLKKQRGKGRS